MHQNDQTALLRILDAGANRAGEGLRVVEDYVRFSLDDRHLTECFKQLRHDLSAALAKIPVACHLAHRLAARDSQADVGASVAATDEYQRESLDAVAAASLKRVQQSLRSLEEFAKVQSAEAALALERIRYRLYTLERAVHTTALSCKRLEKAKLYVLIDGGAPQKDLGKDSEKDSEKAFQQKAEALAAAGVDVLQLRDKSLDDRTLLMRARKLREITQEANVLFIMNDRPDLALLSRADGVHVGQEELTVQDCRRIMGPDAIIGVSTHSLEQAKQAVLDGANYIGVGPTFPSRTKQFAVFPGVKLVAEVSREVRLPAFAIGGVNEENVSQVLQAGCVRIAVSSAVTRAADPAAAVRRLRSLLDNNPQLKLQKTNDK